MAAISPAELEARLRLHLIPELGPQRLRKLISAFPDASSAMSVPAGAWRALGLPGICAESRRSPEVRERAAGALDWLQGNHRHLLMWDDPGYPALLAEAPDAPPLLFVEGDPALLELPQLAMVGSRRASLGGLDNARAFARSLAGAGFVITSGLALGIDGAAHQGALDVGGRTVAVLGTGLCRLYPHRHKALAADIVAGGGALVSELPLDCAPHASNFPRRNRIISGLSLGVLVVEASPSSGSLITARLAAEQGREVYAIPGSIHHPGARGCHQLIRQGAALVECVEDVLQALRGWQQVTADTAPAAPDDGPVDPLIRELRAAPLSSEALALALGRPLGQVLGELTELEVQGLIACENGHWTVRAQAGHY
ncbi:DNA-protecting protein DprA [Stutzerimonas nosocomialis]|uniref:DNA-protecting protein DprA n=1 Tax=Stutzerimonas nosocomialis TaxID=1056496 RepID=A0A5R9QBB2_9GAMM|nr:DNA-processing protein DprA [Stutzerimonas nosocomialis]TLX62391.1 DNA-protecting protein DprA [Stutzerimonas nosocomialis]